MKASAIRSRLCERTWAIQPEAMQMMLARLDAFGDAAIDLKAALPQPSPRAIKAGVAVLPLQGVISHRMDLWTWLFGGTATEQFSADLAAAVADPNVSRIVIDVDSPGGTVDGVPELGAEILAARAAKPVTAVANSLAASAAYWLASQATEFMVAPSAEVGSIGVFSLHIDESKLLADIGIKPTFIFAGKYKVEGNPLEPLTEEAQAAMQARVNEYYDMFVKAVAKGRGVSVADVRSEKFGQGRVMGAAQAVEQGVADKIMTLQQAIGAKGTVVAPNAAQSRAEEDAHRRLKLRHLAR